MKTSFIIMILSISFLSVFPQGLSYEVHGKYLHAIKKEKLHEAKSMGDIIPDYPASWITDYISAEILITSNGKATKATSANNILTTEQASILNTVEMGSDITIDIKYKSKNPVTNNVEIDSMYFSVTVVPDVEAEYSGGHQEMTQYLKEKAISKIPETNAKDLQQAVVRFTVNEKGEITNARISRTSGNQKIDGLLLEAINKMPKWKAAENSKGIKVKQEFEFSVGNTGC